MTVKIYLCGSVKKDKQNKKVCWSEGDKEVIRRVLGNEVELFDPQGNPERPDPFAAFGVDLNDVKQADFILVDARQRRGVGIGAEMAIAKMLKKPVVAVVPRNSHYRRDFLYHFGQEIRDWQHPFIFGLSDAMVESVEEAAKWVKDFLENPKPVKDSSVIEKAIEYALSKRKGKG